MNLNRMNKTMFGDAAIARPHIIRPRFAPTSTSLRPNRSLGRRIHIKNSRAKFLTKNELHFRDQRIDISQHLILNIIGSILTKLENNDKKKSIIVANS